MTRKQMIQFLIDAIEEIEGVKLTQHEFKDYTLKQLKGDVDWYSYLLDK